MSDPGSGTNGARPAAAAEALAGLLRRSPGYLPGWRPEPGTPGHALLEVLARFAGLVDEGLGQIPDKYLLAFLDATGTTLLPPEPARAPLVFTLAEDAPTDVALPADSEVAAVVPPSLPGSLGAPGPEATTGVPPIFATEQTVSLVRARLASVYSLTPGADEYAEHGSELADGFVLFGDTRLLPHHLYLGHATLFELRGAADITLQVGVARQGTPQGPAAAVELRWEYLTAAGWQSFEPVVDQTHGLLNDGAVLLRKVCGAPLVRGVVNGVESYWIRARTIRPLPLPGTTGDAPLPRIDALRARVTLTKAGLPLDAAVNDGVLLDTSKDFRPLGPEPVVGSSLLIACDEAFKREGARIGLSVEPSTANRAAAAAERSLVWEYSTGDGGWARFLQGSAEQFEQGDAHRVEFGHPAEWRSQVVDGQDHFWLRIRLTAGDYGRTEVTGGVLRRPDPPVLARMTVSYSYDTGPTRLDQVLTLNRFDFADRTAAVRWERESFQPLQPVPDRLPAVYFGFDAPLPVGLVSLYVHAGTGDDAGAAAGASPFTWEYRSADGWAELPVLDGTGGFRRSGMIQFVGPTDLHAAPGPGQPAFWVRARFKATESVPEPLPVAGLYLNAVHATHRGTVRREIVGRSDGSAGQSYALRSPPVLAQESVEVQEWRGTGSAWTGLTQELPPDTLRFDRDGNDRVTAVWVRWQERPQLYGSGPSDRHYTLERTTGLLRFGDGRAGAMPPPGAVVTASYRFGGGPEGNVPAGTITQLHSAVPYVQSVGNPVAASGGAAAEDTAPTAIQETGVRARGSQRLRHRNRALCAVDYEWLAKEASPEVALARCRGTTGAVQVTVVPWGSEPQPRPGAELLRRVQRQLARRAPAAIAPGIGVVGPRYQPVSVAVEFTVSGADGAAAVEERLRAALDRFLHPLYGGPGGAGWAFGEPVPLSNVAVVVESTPGVDFATALQLSTDGCVHGESAPIPPDHLPSAGRHLLKPRIRE
ncbi:putative baseplate assembly protein [Streptomyces flaveus]|uniref:putative baseplate assembly protein n=1 Tax=Streptomyces flaveus TaxID=66370 RepID=UPI00332C801C